MLELVLERLATHTTYPDAELIVVDDGSTDASVEILRRWRGGPELTLVEQPAAGAGAALNTALARATGELVVQLDGDATIETPGWLERMVGFLEATSRARSSITSAPRRPRRCGARTPRCASGRAHMDGWRGGGVSGGRGRSPASTPPEPPGDGPSPPRWP